ncbi:MAG: hypothetical protein ACR2HF_02100 [Methylococcaceae bacterium]
MDPLIENFIKEQYPPELMAELMRSFKLLDQYNVTAHEDEIMNVLMTDDISEPIERYYTVLGLVLVQLKRVMMAHKLVLRDEVTIGQYNDWLEALYTLQGLEQYGDIARWLESDLSDEEQLVEIIAYLSSQTTSQLIDQIMEIDEEFMDDLRTFVYVQEQKKVIESTQTVQDEELILRRLKCLQRVLAPETGLGIRLAASGFLPGRPLVVYKGLIGLPWREKDPTVLARDIVSLLMLCDEHQDPMTVLYRKYNTLFLNDLDTIQKVDIAVLKLSLAFEDAWKEEECICNPPTSIKEGFKTNDTEST